METNLLVEIEDQDKQKLLINPAKVVAIRRQENPEYTEIYLFGREKYFLVRAPVDDITEIILKAMDFYNESVMELMVETVRKEMKKDNKKEVFH